MDYLKCEVGNEELRWFGDPILSIEIHFSPEMIAVIDHEFLYEDVILTLDHGTYLVRHWLTQPGTQLRPSVRRLHYSEGTTAEKLKQWRNDHQQTPEQLQVFRWKLIKIQRGIPLKPALPQPVQQEI